MNRNTISGILWAPRFVENSFRGPVVRGECKFKDGYVTMNVFNTRLWFRNLRIKNKLLLSYSVVFILSMTLGFSSIYYVVRLSLERNIESELHNTTTSILNLVETSATVSIKNYLRGVAEKNLEIAGYFYSKFVAGHMDEATAKQMASEVLLSQKIGETGYIYCLDSAGTVVVHPSKPLLSVNVSEYDFAQKMLQRKKGYLEYSWKNIEEQVARPKALYMLHFKPWDWIISVSSYRTEFKQLINVADFKKSVLDFQFGKTGYSFVLDGNGNAVIHPKIQDVNILKAEDLPNEFLEEMLRTRSGELKYNWKNPDEEQPRLKMALYNYLPAYDWIVGSSSYHEEFYEPLKLIRRLIIGIFLVTLLMVLPLTYTLSTSITNPLKALMKNLQKASNGDFSPRMETTSKDELGRLASFFNVFMTQFQAYERSLKKEIFERREIESDLRESEERYQSIMEAAADPIIIYDMRGAVIYFNPAFEKVFGWNLQECVGREIENFVPGEYEHDLTKTLQDLESDEGISKTETRRYTKGGDTRIVSISGALYKDKSGQAAGHVIILRDITEKKRLSKRLLDIGDTVRQEIGQDLHDDLCPHLIGTAGLATVLAGNIQEQDTKNRELTAQIVLFIEKAIEKSRTLARGLCPVHLVAHGLYSAISEIASRVELTTRVTCDLIMDEHLDIQDNLLATHLYYIVQEAVHNAIRHANADKIEISIATKENQMLYLTIADNGSGIQKNALQHGMGLQIMRYRVEVIGALMAINTAPDRGTEIHITLKLS